MNGPYRIVNTMNGMIKLAFILCMAAAAACATGEEQTRPRPDTSGDPAADRDQDPWLDADWTPDPSEDPIAEIEDDTVTDPVPDPAEDFNMDPDMDPVPDPDSDPDLPLDPDLPSDPDMDIEVDDLPPGPGETCDTAIDLTGLSTWSGSFGDFENDWSGVWSCASAFGREVWFTVTVRDGHRFTMEEVSSTDVVIHRLDSCTSTSCAWSSDSPEIFDYYNDTGGDVTFLFVVEAYYAASTGPLQLDITNEAPNPGFDCASAIDISSMSTWTGSLGDYANLWSGGSGCSGGSGREIWFTATVHDGHRFILEEVGSTDVYIHRVASCSSTSCLFSRDEPERFDYFNDTGGDVTFYFIVEAYFSTSTGTVQLDITNEASAGGFTCSTAVDITSLSTWSGSLGDYANLWSGGSGCSGGSGREIWFTATVHDGHRFILEEVGSTDVYIHQVASCSSTSCLFSRDEPERFDYFNDTGGDVTFYFIVEAYYSTSTGTVQLDITNEAPAGGFTCSTAVDITSMSTWSGSFGDYANLWAGGSGCYGGSGREVWFTATVQDGHRFILEEAGSTDVYIHRLASCSSTTCLFSRDEPEKFDFFNDTGAAVTLVLVVEAYRSTSTGPVQLNITNGPPAEGFTCGDAIDVTSLATWSGSFTDYLDLWDGGSGCMTAYGAEIWFTATVANGNTFTFEETTSTDTVLHRVSSCGTTTCTWSSDWPENYSYTNTSGSSDVVTMIVESYGSSSTGSVTVNVTNSP